MFEPVAFLGALTLLATALIVFVIVWAAVYTRVTDA